MVFSEVPERVSLKISEEFYSDLNYGLGQVLDGKVLQERFGKSRKGKYGRRKSRRRDQKNFKVKSVIISKEEPKK